MTVKGLGLGRDWVVGGGGKGWGEGRQGRPGDVAAKGILSESRG